MTDADIESTRAPLIEHSLHRVLELRRRSSEPSLEVISIEIVQLRDRIGIGFRERLRERQPLGRLDGPGAGVHIEYDAAVCGSAGITWKS